jgi:hypothetical protein
MIISKYGLIVVAVSVVSMFGVTSNGFSAEVDKKASMTTKGQFGGDDVGFAVPKDQFGGDDVGFVVAKAQFGGDDVGFAVPKKVDATKEIQLKK